MTNQLFSGELKLVTRVYQTGIMYGDQRVRLSLSMYVPHTKMWGWYSTSYVAWEDYPAVRRVLQNTPGMFFEETKKMKRLMGEAE